MGWPRVCVVVLGFMLLLLWIGLQDVGECGTVSLAPALRNRIRPWKRGDPVDAVVTWVDDSDLRWLRLKTEWKIKTDGEDSKEYARWKNSDEVRFCLRSIRAHAPWIRTIYLVTGFGQKPEWLDDTRARATKPNIRIVDHTEILPQNALPTFNSVAIESGIHRIRGLSDWFLYFNDDVHVGRPTTPDAFFYPDGRVRVMVDGPYGAWSVMTRSPRFLSPRSILRRYIVPSSCSYVNHLTNNADLAARLFSCRERGRMAHQAFMVNKHVVRLIEHHARAEWSAAETSRFRTRDTITPIALVTEAAVDLGIGMYDEESAAQCKIVGVPNDPYSVRTVLDALNVPRPLIYCVNDGGNDKNTPERVAAIQAGLDKLQPHVAPWERFAPSSDG